MAAGKLFDIQGDQIIPKQDCYVIQPIKRVIDQYPLEHPKILAFLHYMKSMRPDDNPYADVPLHIRAEQIMHDLDFFVDLEDPVIKSAMDCVEEKYYTTFYSVYRGFKTILDKIGLQLLVEEANFAKDGNMVAIQRMMQNYEAIRKSFKQAFRDFEEEAGDMKVRGGGHLADDEEVDY